MKHVDKLHVMQVDDCGSNGSRYIMGHVFTDHLYIGAGAGVTEIDPLDSIRYLSARCSVMIATATEGLTKP